MIQLRCSEVILHNKIFRKKNISPDNIYKKRKNHSNILEKIPYLS